MVPVLYGIFPELPPASIISISLGTIVLNTALNNWRFYKQGEFPSKENTLWMIGAAAVGALIGAQILYLLPAPTLKKVFGFLLLAMVARIILSKQRMSEEETKTKKTPLALTCLGGAFVSSITGLGGGAIFVPFFLGFVKLSVHKLSPYSNVAMMSASLVGLIPHLFVPGVFELKTTWASAFFIGHVNVLFILFLFTGAFFSSKAGIKLHGLAGPKTKKYLLAAMLALLSLNILVT